MSQKEMAPEMLDLIAVRFRALGEPARLRILNALRSGARTVTELVNETGLGQTNVSKHLSILRSIGLVVRRRFRFYQYYDIADPMLYKLCDMMCDQLKADVVLRRRIIDRQLSAY